jgi:MFS family permease
MKPEIPSQIRAALALSYCLATSFLYYVTLVQFGLVHHFEGALGFSQSTLSMVLGTMALFGIAGALGCGFWIDRTKPSVKQLFTAIGSVSLLAFGLAFIAFEPRSFLLVATVMAGMGLCLGVLITLLLFSFTRYIHFRLRGIAAGLTAGVSYFGANLIAAYVKEPSMVGTIDGIVIATNVVAIILAWETLEVAVPQPLNIGEPELASSKTLLYSLALLVFLDTFTFYPVGQPGFGPNAVLALPGHWVANGILHLIFALLFGMLAFWFGFRKLLTFGHLAMAASALLLMANHFTELRTPIHWTYSALVAIYTIVLFTIWGELGKEKTLGATIAIGIAICGWIASGSGIAASMVLDKAIAQPWFFAPVAVLALVGAALTYRAKKFS